jgi:hypothetical protein
MSSNHSMVPTLFYFPLWQVAKFGWVLLWMIANQPHLPHKLGKKTLPIKHSMCSYTFLLSSLTSSQIWLSPLVDDRQPTHLPHKLEKKNTAHQVLACSFSGPGNSLKDWQIILSHDSCRIPLYNPFLLMTCGHPWSTYYSTRRKYKKDETGRWTKFTTCWLQIHWGHHIILTALNDEGN